MDTRVSGSWEVVWPFAASCRNSWLCKSRPLRRVSHIRYFNLEYSLMESLLVHYLEACTDRMTL